MMNRKIKDYLIEVARNNPGVRGRVKVAAMLEHKNGWKRYVGVNSYKTHPIMMNKNYKEEQIFLHAEADAIVKALRENESLQDYKLYVLRIKRGHDGKWVEGLAKPCKGCMSLIHETGIKEVVYTEGVDQ